jgi:hypothetical protein
LRLVYLLFQSFFLYSVVVSHSFVQVLPFELRKISDIPDIIWKLLSFFVDYFLLI